MPNFFDRSVAAALLARIDRLSPQSTPLWGTMSVSQMLAHSSKPFETLYDPEYTRQNPKPTGLMKLMIRLLAKPMVVGEKPYKRNGRTAPSFIITGHPDFETERQRLKDYIEQASGEGAEVFEGRESHSFGPLTAHEWSTMFHKHTDHHLTQFGV